MRAGRVSSAEAALTHLTDALGGRQVVGQERRRDVSGARSLGGAEEVATGAAVARVKDGGRRC